MPTTSNFGWTTPADTDLVKDGAAAIRTLGNGIDASLVDLKGGTTGQILSKNSNTDLDYTWINNDQGDITEVQAGTGISVASGTGPVPVVTNTVATTFDAKGDLVVGTGADTFAKLTVGTNDYVLTAASGETTGLKWAAPVTGGMTLLSTTSLTGSDVTVSSISQDYTNLYILVEGATLQTTAGILIARLDGSSTTHQYNAIVNTSTAVSNYVDAQINHGAGANHSTGQTANLAIVCYNYASTTQHKPFTYSGSYYATQTRGSFGGGIFANNSAVDSFQFLTTGGTFSAGSIKIYGVK